MRCLAAGLWLLALGAASAQSPRTVSLRIDNDAFDFWLQPYNRPDEEYTSGVHISVDGGDAPWWARSFLHGAPCTTKLASCRSSHLEIGQDMYTPALSLDSPTPVPGSRSNAGWLYLSQGAQLLAPDRSDDISVTLGVTGPPSLARQTQDLAHDLAPAFNRPTDWDRQIVFQPGVIARYEHRERIALTGDSNIGVDVIPRAAVAVGNVTTDGEVGVQTRIGWHLHHPWLPTDGPLEIALFTGVTGRGVARDIFLDGRTANDSGSVGHKPFVGSGELGLEFRYRWATLVYRAVGDTRSYTGGPGWHPWASIVGAVTFVR
ncbi:MAG: lipid A deacylase LpxR family protein [Gemmatimonadaceae bacterium]